MILLILLHTNEQTNHKVFYRLGFTKKQIKLSKWGSANYGHSQLRPNLKMSHCKMNWYFSCRNVVNEFSEIFETTFDPPPFAFQR